VGEDGFKHDADLLSRCQAKSAHISQSRPYSGLDLSHFQGKILQKRLSCSLCKKRDYPRVDCWWARMVSSTTRISFLESAEMLREFILPPVPAKRKGKHVNTF